MDERPVSYLAFDLGASSSRAVLGTLAEGVMEMEELHRFPTPVLEAGDGLFWDIGAMRAEMEGALGRALREAPDLRSLSVDSWAVDYVSLDASGEPVGNPRCYRDPRTEGRMERAFGTLSREEIFRITGIQFLPFNTLYQLLAEAEEPAEAGRVDCRLPVADYFNFVFSGRRAVERSMASTTQLMDVHSGDWSRELMSAFGLGREEWHEIVPSGTILGEALDAPGVSVVAGCSHDTGAAVAAAPAAADGGDWAYVSAGTWSLMGDERSAPLLSRGALEGGFTNEAGLDGSIRFLKNLTGLWVLQECVREWRRSGPVSWADVEVYATKALGSVSAPATGAAMHLEDPVFLPRGDMEHRIHAYRKRRGLPALSSRGEIVLSVVWSIAESYRRTLEDLESTTGLAYERIHLIGGGSRNPMLCKLTARLTGREVVAGPAEATALGNLLIQARALGDLPDGQSIRDIAAASGSLQVYCPDDAKN